MENAFQFKVNRIISFFVIIVASNSYWFTEITNLKEYNQKWLQMVPPQFVHNYTSKYKTTERCNNQQCQFYVYQYSQKRIQQQQEKIDKNDEDNFLKDRQDQQRDMGKATILLVAGMHGNQLIGPTTLLYAYRQLTALKPFRILFFPIANPSGFYLKKRQASNNVDPNRDFPFQNNKTCYGVASTSILQDIFRHYKIDITISLHNGGTEIAWVWGSPSYKKNPRTSEQSIYQTIGKALAKYGGQNNILQPFKIGTMNEVVYAVQGGFEDWVYGASFQKDKFTAGKCASHTIQPYPQDMTRSLSFIWELGPHKTSSAYYGSSQGINMFSNSTNSANGYVSRAIRMLKQIVFIANPKINIQISTSQIAITLLGCSQAKVNLRAIPNNAQEVQELFILNEYVMSGSLKQESYYPIHYFPITINLTENLKIYYSYEFVCDQNWNNLGRTIFSQHRIFQGDDYLKVQKQPIQRKIWKAKTQSIFIPVLITVVLILIAIFSYVIYIIHGKLRLLSEEQERRKKNIKKSIQVQMKYQTVNNLEEQNAQ